MCQPTFPIGLPDRQTQGKLFKPYRVAGILRIDRVNRVSGMIHVNAVLVGIA